MKLPDFYTRMNRRERLLVFAVSGVVFALINFLVWSWLFGAIGRSREELATRDAARQEQAVYTKERDLWTKRSEWLQQHQPVMKNSAEASTLLEQIKQVAGKHNILIENPALGAGESTPNHQAVFASLDTKSPWPPLVHFLYDLQQPDAFIVFESVSLAVDGSDPTMMRGKFKIVRWFAPNPQLKK
jgi:hypothetical protein